MSVLVYHSWWRTLKLLSLVGLGLLALLSLNASDSSAIEEAEALFIEGSVDASIELLESLDLKTIRKPCLCWHPFIAILRNGRN